MSLPRVVITDFIKDDLAPESSTLGDIATVEALDATSERQLIGRIEDATAIMLYHNLELTSRTINRLDKCRLIVRCGVGYDNVDLVAAREKGIVMANVPDYGTEEVADSAIGMVLALARGISFLNSRLRQRVGLWSYEQVRPLRRLRGEVFGIVGLGRIGTATAHRAKALGMEVVFYDPYRSDDDARRLGVRRAASMNDLLSQAFILSLHCPLTQQTRGMIDAAALHRMPAGAFLVNTARGAIVDNAAVADAIASGQLGGAAIDVLENEPPNEDEPLVTAWRDPDHRAHHRVLINPHSAFYSEGALLDMRRKGAHACRCAILGMPVPNLVGVNVEPAQTYHVSVPMKTFPVAEAMHAKRRR